MNKFVTLAFFSLLLCGCQGRPPVYNNGDSVVIHTKNEQGRVIGYEWSILNSTWEYSVQSRTCTDGCTYLEFQLMPDNHMGYDAE